MTAVYIVLAVAAALFCIGNLRAHITISLKEDLNVYFRFLFLKKRLLTTKKKLSPMSDYVPPETKRKKKKKPKKEKKKSDDGKKTDILSLVNTVLKIIRGVLKKTKRYLRIRVRSFRVSVATGDAAKTAVLYGALGGVMDIIFDAMKSAFRFKVEKNADIGLDADFLAEKTRASIEIDLYFAVWHLLSIALGALWTFIRNPFKKKAEKEEEKAPAEA